MTAIGWALLHSLWQFAIVVLLLAAILRILRASPARYIASCAALCATIVIFATTLICLSQRTAAQTLTSAASESGSQLRENEASTSTPRISPGSIVPWLTRVWIFGTMLFQVRTLAAWLSVRRLRIIGICAPPKEWRLRFVQLQNRLKLSRSAVLLESALAEVPLAAGWLRPVVLFPAGMFTAMPTAQLEAILLHELAHVRRNDYLVNALQSLTEALLFYHPAVWWISRMIRIEREHCCDDIVVSLTGDAPQYAAALASLEQNRCAATRIAIAAAGGNLVTRIRRILHPLEQTRSAAAPALSAGVLVLTAAAALMAWQSAPVPHAKLEGEQTWQQWLNEDVAYIITEPERNAFLKLTDNDERERFAEQFWKLRDPTPGTAKNEFKEEHYRRIAYANTHYSASKPGWRTDRGRIYIAFGPPNEMEVHPFGQAPDYTAPFERWHYRWIEGKRENVLIEFIYYNRAGDFQITRHDASTAP